MDSSDRLADLNHITESGWRHFRTYSIIGLFRNLQANCVLLPERGDTIRQDDIRAFIIQAGKIQRDEEKGNSKDASQRVLTAIELKASVVWDFHKIQEYSGKMKVKKETDRKGSPQHCSFTPSAFLPSSTLPHLLTLCCAGGGLTWGN